MQNFQYFYYEIWQQCNKYYKDTNKCGISININNKERKLTKYNSSISPQHFLLCFFCLFSHKFDENTSIKFFSTFRILMGYVGKVAATLANFQTCLEM